MPSKKTQDIRSRSLADLEAFMQSQDMPAYRAAQVYRWIWKNAATSFDQMLNLPVTLRKLLNSHFDFRPIAIQNRQVSNDGTIKVAFRLFDHHLIEGVLIPAGDRLTACISSQVGCSLSCKFCATGFMGRIRNLEPGEIFDQVILLDQLAEEHFSGKLTNIVLMGMGEPLLNYNNVLFAINRLTEESGRHMSARRITLSTAGIAKMIRKLANDEVRVNLALSLHATTDKARNNIMPINEQNDLDSLLAAIQYFKYITGNKVTFEYVLLRGVNDTLADAKRLVLLAQRVAVKVNIIEYNPVENTDFHRASAEQRNRFVSILEQHGVTATVRISRGKDIHAACGQLANKTKESTR